MFEYLMEISISVIQFLQTEMAWLAPVMKFFTFLGNEEFYLLIMPILVWSVDHRAGIRLGVMLMISGVLNTYLKVGIHQPRPYWVSSRISNLIEPMGSFGLPSGHSQNAAAVFGLVASSSKRNWFKGLMIFTIVMIAFSRLYLGVHSIADITLGLLVGVILLYVFVKSEKKVKAFFIQLKPAVRICIVFACSIALLLIGVMIVRLFEMPLPELWLENVLAVHPEESIAPFSIDGLITSTGTLFGLVAGSIWINEKGGYEATSGKVWQHIVRFVLGIIGVLLIWRGLGMVFPRNADLVSHSLRYFRYALIGVWISGIAPYIFKSMKLTN